MKRRSSARRGPPGASPRPGAAAASPSSHGRTQGPASHGLAQGPATHGRALSRRELRWAARAFLLLATALVWRGAASTYFGADDVVLLDRISAHGLAGGPWRLLDRLVLRLEWGAFGSHPLPYHLAQLAAHALNVQLLLSLALSLGLGLGAALLGAALFAAHPLSFGCVYPPSGLGTVAGMTCLLGAACVWREARPGAARVLVTITLGILAAGFKETYAPGILALAWLAPRAPEPRPAGSSLQPPTRSAPGRWEWLLPAGLTLVAGAILVVAALRGPLAGSAYGLDLAQIPRAAGRYLDWLFAPRRAVPDFIADVRGVLHPAALAFAAVLALSLTWSCAAAGGAPATAARLGWTWILALGLPALLTPLHLYLYYLYGSLAGAALLLGGAACALPAVFAALDRRVVAAISMVAAAGAVAWGAWAVPARQADLMHNAPYLSDPFMRQQDIVRNFVEDVRGQSGSLDGPVLFLNPGLLLEGGAAGDTAVLHNNPIAAATDSGRVLSTFGVLQQQVRFGGAFSSADTAWTGMLYLGNGHVAGLGRGPRMLSRVADFYATDGEWPQVAAALQSYLALAPRDTSAWFNLTLARMQMARPDQAREPARRFLELSPAGQRADWARAVLAGRAPAPAPPTTPGP